MTKIDDLIARVAARARAECPTLPPPVGDPDVNAAEDALGFHLPPLLARLYRDVANGGFGPDYQLFPLVGEGPTAVDVYREERAHAGGTGWPAGVLPILHWGCGMYAAVDCTTASSTVLLFEPNVYQGDWADAWFLDAETLDGWLEGWLSGNAWYEEENLGNTEPPEPRPWTDARERLARIRG
ncbi:SMI1/KNR4 family protein [Actinomadura sediminis]|uniref:SMI1/KNR4 family protein n=1 Tax=Actinomadura sediminis TaxID=1038904 RepID=A0ABW3F0J6_9ACTN